MPAGSRAGKAKAPKPVLRALLSDAWGIVRNGVLDAADDLVSALLLVAGLVLVADLTHLATPPASTVALARGVVVVGLGAVVALSLWRSIRAARSRGPFAYDARTVVRSVTVAVVIVQSFSAPLSDVAAIAAAYAVARTFRSH